MGDEPVATGTLAKTPLPHLLVYLDQRQLSGTLAIWQDAGPEGESNRPDRILLLKGRPIAGRLNAPEKTLREGLLKLFERSEAPYAFYDQNLLGSPEERQNGRVDPLALITESLRVTAREDVVEGVLARMGSSRLRLQPKVELARFELMPDERALVELLMAEPASVEVLVDGSGLPRARGRRLVYLLIISKAIAPYEPQEGAASTHTAASVPVPAASGPDAPEQVAVPLASPPSPSSKNAGQSMGPPPHSRYSSPPINRLDRMADMPTPPDDLSPELRERWRKITTRGRLIENQNYFEMLGVDKKILSQEVKGEFFKLAKEWHPDRLPAELAPLRPYVEIIFAFMNEAHKVLSDEEQRIAYLRSVREGGGTPAAERLMQAIIDSAVAYERVQVFARKHQYDDALELLQKILLITKDEPDYHAMHGFLLMQKFPGEGAPIAKIFDSLDRAIQLHEDHERAHSYKAQLLKRLGRHEEAMKHFKKVVSINPSHLEASREVRIAQMREDKQHSTAGRSAAAGLFGKLLGGGDKKKKS